ncbi:MAG: ATP-binding cassette domain-containing protein [Myxococcales bacterium]|nr:ATP-binding cassette domain-containing protein [Myxococcales bacterium]
MASNDTSQHRDNVVRPFSFFRSEGSPKESKRPLVELQGVSKYFDRDKPILRQLTLSVERGEFVFITGPSGSGKSTLLKLLYRELISDEGHVYFCGRDVGRLSPASVPYLRRNIGVVFQDFRVIGRFSATENVALPMEVLNMAPRIVRARVSEALERVGLEGRGMDLAHTLSGGEQQRLAVARAIVTEPALVLADEPTGNLDPHLALDILTLFEEINASGITVVFATHDHSLLEARPHRLVVLEEGRITEARHGLRSYHSDIQALTG